MHLKSSFVTALFTLAAAGAAHAITFNTFVTSGDLSATLGNNATIGFAYAGDKFVGSVYYGANNNQLYSTDLTGGNVQKFGTAIAGFSGEVYVSSSLGGGGFGPRDVYAGAESAGIVYRIAHDGSSQGIFVSGLVGGVRSIAFDPYGLYGYSMIVATNAGRVYQVSNAGVAVELANVGEDVEGLSFAPLAFGGRPAGTLFVASEGSGSLRAINPDGSKQTLVSGLYGAEMVSFVPLNLGTSGNPVEGFYAAAYPYNIQRAAASEFVPYIGQAIITGEGGHQVWAVNGSLQVSFLSYFPAQPEDGIFVTADIITGTLPDHTGLETFGLGLAFVALGMRRRQSRAA